ncbi:MAG: tetratricopeptide repeat protein, partial [Gemmatimonadetes bacterium]|nr:tetratricopeptide repeat protein [Gemmatimonadota bacterium]
MAYTSEIEKLERRFAENPSGRNFAPLADAYRKAGELDRAIELCKGGLERHPDYVSAHIVYGRCLMDMKNDAEAEQVFQKILSLDPENIIALKVLADIADRNGRYEDTVQWLSRLLAADPMNGDASEALARAKGKAALAAKVTEPIVPPAAVEETVAGLVPPPAEPPAPATEPEPAVRESGLIDIDVALAQAPTTAITKPDFVIERAAIQEAPPALEAAPPS